MRRIPLHLLLLALMGADGARAQSRDTSLDPPTHGSTGGVRSMLESFTERLNPSSGAAHFTALKFTHAIHLWLDEREGMITQTLRRSNETGAGEEWSFNFETLHGGCLTVWPGAKPMPGVDPQDAAFLTQWEGVAYDSLAECIQHSEKRTAAGPSGTAFESAPVRGSPHHSIAKLLEPFQPCTDTQQQPKLDFTCRFYRRGEFSVVLVVRKGRLEIFMLGHVVANPAWNLKYNTAQGCITLWPGAKPLPGIDPNDAVFISDRDGGLHDSLKDCMAVTRVARQPSAGL